MALLLWTGAIVWGQVAAGRVDPVSTLAVVACWLCGWGYVVGHRRPLVLLLVLALVPALWLPAGGISALAVLPLLALVGWEDGWAGALFGASVLATAEFVSELSRIRAHPVEGVSFTIISALGFALVSATGILLARAERARTEAERRGAQLDEARARLEGSVVTERELVLAKERARSARELHDGLGHRLTLVAMSLDYALRMREREPALAWAEVDTAAATTRSALESIGTWGRAMGPPVPLSDAGGAEAFEPIAAAFRGTGLEVGVVHHGADAPLPAPVAVYATRLVQEGLTNVLRHARAGRVDVQIRQSPQQVRIAVVDDGHGSAPVPEGFGLRSLRERAADLGGTLSAGPAPGGGWQIVTVLPLVGHERGV